MGLLSSIGKIATNALKSFETVVQAPIKSIQTIGNQAAFNALSEKVNSAPLTTQIGKIVLNTGTAAAAVVGGGAALGSTTAKSIVSAVAPVVSKVIPSTTKGKVIAAVAAPVVVGAIANQPTKAIKAAVEAPANLANFGGNVANLAANPSVANLKTLVTENPVIAAGTALAGAAAIGGGIGLAANTVATFANSQATKANTEASVGSDLPITVVDKSAGFVPSTPATQLAATAPVTPQTNIAKSSSTGKVRRQKRKSARSLPSISQRVNVVVQQNKSSRTTKNYINREVLLN